MTLVIKMEFCDEINMGLKVLGSSNLITEDCYSKLLDLGLCSVIGNRRIPNLMQLCNVNGDRVKEAYASLLSLLVESAKYDISCEELSRLLLNKYSFTNSRCEKLANIYGQNKQQLLAALSSVGTHLPHIVDASWTLDYCIKGSCLDQVGAWQYLIQLHTESGGELNIVRFTCSVEELYDLVSKLKEAVRQVEKIAHV